MEQIWLRKYSPKALNEVIGQSEQTAKLKTCVMNYRKGKSIFLYAGTGNGKTASVYALANELDMELVELNASDVRKKVAIESLLGGVINQGSLFGTNKLILVDEIEGVSGVKDRGALQAVAAIISKSKYPVIIIGHDAYDKKAKPVKKISELIKYNELTFENVLKILKNICDKEKIVYEENALKQLARFSGGDARAAINDLQSLSTGKTKITSDLVSFLGDRDNTKSIQEALHRVFKTTNPEVALNAYDDINEDLDKIFLWVEENIPLEYLEPKTLKNAFENLSLADVFYGQN